MTKREYHINMPITGVAFLIIEAENEEQAIEKFYEEVSISDVQEWQCVEKIVKGNVFYGIQNEMEIEEGEEI